MPPNQLVDMASKKLFAAFATGDLLRFRTVEDTVFKDVVVKFEAVNMLGPLIALSRPRPRPDKLLMGKSANLAQLDDSIMTLCSFCSNPFCDDVGSLVGIVAGMEDFMEARRAKRSDGMITENID